jgi:hypothetical protein
MACFIAPAAEAIIVTIIRSNIIKKEKAALTAQAGTPGGGLGDAVPFSQKLGWLLKLLWGGCFLLAIEHIWHGEVVPWPPFLTAMSNPADIHPMLMEIATVARDHGRARNGDLGGHARGVEAS